MYGREYAGKALNFEASGGLINASLVMQDKETDSYWAIMSGEALAGELEGTRLDELPVGMKMEWKDWVARHPDTLVLSIGGVEHEEDNHYDNYFSNEEGFRGQRADDRRLPTKEPIYSFHMGDRAFAVPHSVLENGAAFEAGERQVFLYRPPGVAVFYSTLAWVGPAGTFEERDGVWHATGGEGAAFDAEKAGFPGAAVERLDGFDTYWYNWSLNNPGTEILTAGP